MFALYRRAPWQAQLLTIFTIVAILIVIGFLALRQFQAGDPNVSVEPTSVDVGGAANLIPPGERPFGLHVIGEGEVVVPPDRAIVTLGVEASAETAAEAADEANATAEKLIEAIRGVSSNEREVLIQTTGLSLSPVFPPAAPEQRTVSADPVGYRSANTVTVTIDRIDLTSRVLDAALGAGANSVRSISFTLQDDGPAKAEALRLATLDAAAKARAVADALRGSVRGVISLHEDSIYVPVARSEFAMARPMAAAPAAAAVPVEAGELRIRATVRANFAYE